MSILAGLLLGFPAAFSPGAFQAYLLARSLKNGWRGTWSAAFAPLLSDGPVILIVLLLLTQVPAWLVRGLRLAGGLFLFYLAWDVFASLRAKRELTGGEHAEKAGGQTLRQAALMNILSPGPWLFWSTVAGPAFLQGWQRTPLEGVSFLLGFYTAMIVSLLGLVGLFSALGRGSRRVVRLLHGLSGVLLAGFGLYQLIMLI